MKWVITWSSWTWKKTTAMTVGTNAPLWREAGVVVCEMKAQTAF